MTVVSVVFYSLLYILDNTLHITTSILVMESNCSVYLQLNRGGVSFGGRVHCVGLILAIAKCQPKS